MDADGAPVAYHVLKQHPGALLGPAREWDVVPAYGAQTGRRNAIHLFERRRPGQSRGVPYLAPVIETLKQLDRYTEAEIAAAVVAGLFAVFVTSEGDGLSPLESATLGITPGSGGDTPQAGMGRQTFRRIGGGSSRRREDRDSRTQGAPIRRSTLS